MTALLVSPLASALSYFQAIVLGVLQGITELFPISSLGHTVLFPTLFGWNELVKAQSQSESFWLAFVVMLHVGSAVGLLIYFWHDWVEIVAAFFRTLRKRRADTPSERLAWLIIIASIPAGVIGLALEHPLRTLTAKPEVAAVFLMVNGLVLFAAERYRRRAQVRELAARRRVAAEPAAADESASAQGGELATLQKPREGSESAVQDARELATLDYREAVVVGFAQSTALLAGISRDGVTMGTGLARGLDHSDSARFAFLLATPIILAAGLVKLPDLLGHLGDGIRGQALVAALSAAVTAVFTVAFLMRYFKTRTLIPFAIYCLGFGAFMTIYTLA
ncbi:MAG TPA: undecaprenyl-diphosphate phosphatase [Solirubrobacteraceae bacterium]|nr:undecaprenyl-diphosphate phosphatase [Solirubrobacteraceae bacterium]